MNKKSKFFDIKKKSRFIVKKKKPERRRFNPRIPASHCLSSFGFLCLKKKTHHSKNSSFLWEHHNVV